MASAVGGTKQTSSVQRYLYDHLVLAAVVVGLSGALTYLEIAGPPSVGSLFGTKQAPAAPAPSAAAPGKPSATPTAPVPAVAPVAAPTPTPPPPVIPTATTVSFVHMRAAKTTAAPILADLQAGTTVELIDDSNPSWQGVKYQGQIGYIFKSYLQYTQ